MTAPALLRYIGIMVSCFAAVGGLLGAVELIKTGVRKWSR